MKATGHPAAIGRSRARSGRRGPWLLLGLLLAGCAGAPAPRSAALTMPEGPLECVPYARQVSGIEIHGDAWTWWDSAAGLYERGSRPRFLAVLVLRKTGRLPLGHLAVVVDIVGAREIRVTHANWGSDRETRDKVREAMPVVDVSPGNDWSQVRFWNEAAGAYGRVYPAQGFIYSRSAGPV